jgi:hypothetical protein
LDSTAGIAAGAPDGAGTLDAATGTEVATALAGAAPAAALPLGPAAVAAAPLTAPPAAAAKGSEFCELSDSIACCRFCSSVDVAEEAAEADSVLPESTDPDGAALAARPARARVVELKER